MPEVHVSLSFEPYLVAAALLAAVGLSVLAYRSTVPPIRRSLRCLLGTLRGVGLFLLFLLLGEPLLTFIRRIEHRPGILVLIDNSRSMALDDRNENRGESVRRVLASPALEELSGAATVSHALFDGGVTPLPSLDEDSLRFTGARTNLEVALEWAQHSSSRNAAEQMEAFRNLQAVLVVSDGVITEGAVPTLDAPELGFPVFTIGVGDTMTVQDLVVRSVSANALAHRGTKVPVVASIHSTGMGDRRIEAVLSDGGRPVDRRSVVLAKEVSEYRVPFSFTADSVGERRLVVEVSAIEGERTVRNNRAAASIRVLESKMRVYLVAGGPSPDVSFLRRGLEGDSNIDLRTRIGKSKGVFYEGPFEPAAAESADVLVLVGFPTAATADNVLHSIKQVIEGKPNVFFVMSRTVDQERLKQLEAELPFRIEAAGSMESRLFITVAAEHRFHPLFRLSGNRFLADLVSKLPPLFTLQGEYRQAPDARILAVGAAGAHGEKPFVVSRASGRKKSLAVLGYGLWQWDLQGLPAAGENLITEDLLNNALRWLVTNDDERLVRVRPARESVEGGETLEFVAEVYDESLYPISDAEVVLTVEGGGRSYPLALTPEGEGRYANSLPGLPEGRYRYEAMVSRGGAVLGKDRGAVTVEEATVEFRETTLNKDLLQQVAERSGGKYYDAGHLETLPQDLRNLAGFRPREEVRSTGVRPMNIEWFLAVVVLLFAAEWILRRRSGML